MHTIQRTWQIALAPLLAAVSIAAFTAAANADQPAQGCVGTECTYQITTDTPQWGQIETTQPYTVIPYVPPVVPPPVVDNTPKATFSKVSAVRRGSKIKVSGVARLVQLPHAVLEAWTYQGKKRTGYNTFVLKNGNFSITMPAGKAKSRRTVKIVLEDGWPRTLRVK